MRMRSSISSARAAGPIYITRNGKSAAVLLDVETFERLVKTIDFSRILAPGVKDMIGGRRKSLEQFIEEFESAKKKPGSRRRKNRARHGSYVRPYS
ncbi:MAG: type II toxin-antitoxin system prevent-host-death family antitoxin [Gemmataceae bacterium]